MNQISIKPLTDANLPRIMELDERFGSSWSPSFYRQRLSMFSNLAYGAYKNGELIGFVLGKQNPDNTLVSRVVVDKQYEGHGIGTQLLQKLKSVAPTPLTSTVRKDNIPSLKIHKRVGFTPLPETYTYQDGTPGYKMKTKKKGWLI